MGRKGSSSEAVCKKCAVAVKNYVVCAKCESSYHPACILRVRGTFVDVNGDVFCCACDSAAGSCCAEKSLEIAALKTGFLTCCVLVNTG